MIFSQQAAFNFGSRAILRPSWRQNVAEDASARSFPFPYLDGSGFVVAIPKA
jgi:hypothetical protein